jgi:hypothetical protein
MLAKSWREPGGQRDSGQRDICVIKTYRTKLKCDRAGGACRNLG